MDSSSNRPAAVISLGLRLQRRLTATLALLLALLLVQASMIGPACAESGLVIQDLQFKPLDSDNEWVTLKLNGSYTPKPFTIKGERPRVVFDFLGVGLNRNVSSMQSINGKLVKRIRIGLHPKPEPKARVVFDLTPGANAVFDYQFDKSTNSLNIHFFRQGHKNTPAKTPVFTEETAPAASDPTPSPGQKKEQTTPAAQTKEPVAPAASQGATDQQTSAAEPTTAQAPAAVKPADEKPTEPAPPAGDKSSVAQQVAPAQPQAKPTSAPPYLESVDFDGANNRGEMVKFKLNDFYPPVVFGIEEGIPRVVCDFENTTAAKSVENEIKANGRFVKMIRVGKHTGPNKVRVVLDLVPNNNYDLQQVFFKEDNLFVIIVNTLKSSEQAE